MTPMVDLAFLLLTFFVLTAHLIEQRALELRFPLAGPSSPADHALTLLLHENGAVSGYRGEFQPGITRVVGFRAGELPIVLRAFLSDHGPERAACIVKADGGSRYGSVIDVVDEVNRAGFARLNVLDSITDVERAWSAQAY